MRRLQIFDPAMCCSTGVCGPNVDAKLVRLAADAAFLKSKGVEVERFNLGHQPEAFAANPLVLSEMGQEAEHLPIFVVDGKIAAKGTYPSRTEMAGWFGLEAGAATDKQRVGLNILGSCGCSDKGGCC